MPLSKNKKYQYLFFSILSIFIIFNGGNSNLFIQLNFILISLFFLFCLKDKNYQLHFQNFCNKNRAPIIFFSLFLVYLFFQILPLPLNFLKFLSPEKYKIISNLKTYNLNSALSLSPTETFFQIINFITIFLVIITVKMTFYTERHKFRLYLFLSFSGFISSLFAIILFLNGNPDFLFLKKIFYINSSTGFFINRTVFSIFLLFCFISSFEILKNLRTQSQKLKNKNFFLLIYVRLFVIFISIGIITSFSRIGNFLFLLTILFYLINEIFLEKNRKNSLSSIILIIIFFDILILGFYFGTSKLIDRFYFLNEEFASISINTDIISRFQIIKFSLYQIKDFFLFGYGAGAYESLFQLFFNNSNPHFADHAHSDIIEFFGEYGLIGFSLIFCALLKIVFNFRNYKLICFILYSYIAIILAFDFMLHIPLIQILFVIFFSINKKSYGSS